MLHITRAMANHISPWKFAKHWRFWLWVYRSAIGGYVVVIAGRWWHVEWRAAGQGALK